MINGAIYGYSNKGKIVFGVSLKYDKFEHKKVIRLKNGTINTAEIQAAEYALRAIKPEHRDMEININTCNAYVPRMLQKNDDNTYKSASEKNANEVAALRKLTELFRSVKFNIEKSDVLEILQNEVKTAK